MFSSKRVLLLATILIAVAAAGSAAACAHDRNAADTVDQRNPLLHVVTSSTTTPATTPVVDAAAADAAKRYNASSTPLASVVEDWSLVCKELCGAGLGGVPCAAQCANTKADEATLSAASMILPSNKDLICRDLCTMQLGATMCGCENVLSTAAAMDVDVNGVCHAFCVHNNVTLRGCTACAIEAATEAAGHQALALAPTDANQRQLADAGVSTTTPDWNELCESLCKTGDGGSLCNCDLSPFKK